jgi:hypothetical protein
VPEEDPAEDVLVVAALDEALHDDEAVTVLAEDAVLLNEDEDHVELLFAAADEEEALPGDPGTGFSTQVPVVSSQIKPSSHPAWQVAVRLRHAASNGAASKSRTRNRKRHPRLQLSMRWLSLNSRAAECQFLQPAACHCQRG